MKVAAPTTPSWTVSTRQDGEVLTTWCGGDDLQLCVLATPGDFTTQEYEGWLNDLAGVARETARTGSRPGPIPALLHQALSGLLFSHAELWEEGGGPHASVALVASDDEIGIGWVGEVDVEVALDGDSLEVPWVIVRDADGREARSARFDARHWVRASMMWTPDPDSSAGVMIDAEWSGASAPAAASGTAPEDELIDASETAEDAPADWGDPAHSGESEAPAKSRAARFAPAQERSNPIARFWNRLTRRPRRAIPVMTESADDPPWVDVGGLATEADSETFMRREPAPAAAAPRRAVPRASAPPAAAPPATPPAAPRVAPVGAVVVRGARAPLSARPPELGEAPQPRLVPEDEPDADDERELGANAGQELDSGPDAAELETELGTEGEENDIEEEPAESGRDEPEWNERELPEEENEDDVVPIGDPASPKRPSISAPVPWAKIEPGFEDIQFLNDPAPRRGGRAVARALEPEEREDPDVDADADAGVRVPLRPRWPSAAEQAGPAPWWTRRWVWAVAVTILFGGGWLVGGIQPDRDKPATANPLSRMLRAIGLGGAIYECSIDSRPPGAWIAVDGKDIARRTPTTLELKPGPHDITLSFADLGGATFHVQGEKGERVSLDEALWGTLSIEQVDPSIPVTVAVDGRALGYAPAQVDSMTPGAHEVRFSGPGMTPWAQTVGVHVREDARIIARPMTAPGTGVLVVSATMNDEQGSTPLEGGEVRIDGQERGKTPLTLELPRGPHSVRVSARGESAPVQVIDLPGGNQRFATFELGLGAGGPQLVPAQVASHVAADRPTLVSAALDGVRVSDIHEMWLHVRGADGPWRRYALDIMRTPTGAVGVTVFPLGVFDGQTSTLYYLSALTSTGDEYFTEITTAQVDQTKH